MCSRYVRRSDKQKIAGHFRASPNPAEFPLPNAEYNVAPTTYQTDDPAEQGIRRP